jgi:uridine kinase
VFQDLYFLNFVTCSKEYYKNQILIFIAFLSLPGGENLVAIDLIVQHVRAQLVAKGHKLREELVAEANGANGANGDVLPTSMHIVPMTPQIRGLHSFIRNKNTPRDEFTFYAKRLIRIVIEHALSLMPYQSITVISLSFSPDPSPKYGNTGY